MSVRHCLLYAALLFTISCKKVGNSEKTAKFLPTPVGAVVPFNSAVCPDGWEEFAPAKGRIIFGVGSGNKDSKGAGLTARLRGDFGGLEMTSGIPASTSSASDDEPNTSMVLGASTMYIDGIGDVSLGSDFTDSNLPPFTALNYCKKTADHSTDLSHAIVAKEGSCASPWTDYLALNGRMVLGSGVGNLDSMNVGLLSRNLNDLGGVEDTPNMLACYGNPTSGTPGPSKCLAEPAFDLFLTGSKTAAMGGQGTDSNLPPYLVLQWCESGSSTDGISSGNVVAFDLDTCPDGWSMYAGLRGRTILGAGSGNTDAVGNSLRNRTLLATGGLEYTTGVPTDNTNADSDTLSLTSMLGISGASTYVSSAPNTTINGPKGDSNMPPYYVLLYCQKD